MCPSVPVHENLRVGLGEHLAGPWVHLQLYKARSPTTFTVVVPVVPAAGCPAWILCCSVLGQGQRTCRMASLLGLRWLPCGFIFIFIMVNGIRPFSINFSGHLVYFSFLFFFNTAQIFPHFFSIEWFCFLVCFKGILHVSGVGITFGLCYKYSLSTLWLPYPLTTTPSI